MDLASGSVYTIPTIIFGVSIGLIKILECIQMKYISNTKLIIKQSEQIQFLLVRLIDLNKKIEKLEINMNTSSSSTFLDDEVVDEVVGKISPVVTTVTTMTDKLNSFKNLIPAGTEENLKKIDEKKQQMSDINKKQKALKVGSTYPTTELELEAEKAKLESQKEALAAEIEGLLKR